MALKNRGYTTNPGEKPAGVTPLSSMVPPPESVSSTSPSAEVPGGEGLALQSEPVAFGEAEAVDLVVAGARSERIVVDAVAAQHGVVAVVAPDRVIAGAADDAVMAEAAEHQVGATARIDLLVAWLPNRMSAASPVASVSAPKPPITVLAPSSTLIESLPPLPQARSAPLPAAIVSPPSAESLPPTMVLFALAAVDVVGALVAEQQVVPSPPSWRRRRRQLVR
jgi:hypothetical protein